MKRACLKQYRPDKSSGNKVEELCPVVEYPEDIPGNSQCEFQGIVNLAKDGACAGAHDIFAASERDIAAEHIEKLKEFGLKNALIIFDRGYPSGKLILQHQNSGINYLMRVPSQFLKAINEAKEQDQIARPLICGDIPININKA